MGRQRKVCWLKYHNLRNTCFRSSILFYQFALFFVLCLYFPFVTVYSSFLGQAWALQTSLYICQAFICSPDSQALQKVWYIKKTLLKYFDETNVTINLTVHFLNSSCLQKKTLIFLTNSVFTTYFLHYLNLLTTRYFGNYPIKFEC